MLRRRDRNRNDRRAALTARSSLLAVGLLVAAGCTPFATDTSLGSQQGDADAVRAEVEHVIDGDTVDLLFEDTTGVLEERVRLIGIDAPESVSRSDPKQCFGDEASAALTGLLPVGSEVLVTRDREARDRFGRLLAYLERPDGLDVNLWLIEQGFADALFFEPNTSRRGEFTDAADAARSEGRGLWGVSDGPDQPLDAGR